MLFYSDKILMSSVQTVGRHDWIVEWDAAVAPRGNVEEIGREMSDGESRNDD